MSEEYTCGVCGNSMGLDAAGWAICCGTFDTGPHETTRLARPCAFCGETIQTGEMCVDCAEEKRL